MNTENITYTDCGHMLPASDFRRTRFGTRVNVCNKCVADKYRATRAARREASRPTPRYSDPEFDGKDPVEVIQLMSRARQWLQAQGYNITLSGYRNVRKAIKL